MGSEVFPVTEKQTATVLLSNWSAGNEDALNQLIPLIYEQLHKLAAWRLQSTPVTVNPTTLVHELYLKLADGKSLSCKNKVHFLAIAGQMMRNILIDQYRTRNAGKRGGGAILVTLDDSLAQDGINNIDLIALDEALDELETMNPMGSRLIELRFFVGLTLEETAEMLDVSLATVKREWAASRAWIKARISGL
jgi:RNA polymerase sigma factor (TIGR02999 family)